MFVIMEAPCIPTLGMLWGCPRAGFVDLVLHACSGTESSVHMYALRVLYMEGLFFMGRCFIVKWLPDCAKRCEACERFTLGDSCCHGIMEVGSELPGLPDICRAILCRKC